jgi:hypothetical protein
MGKQRYILLRVTELDVVVVVVVTEDDKAAVVQENSIIAGIHFRRA